MKFDGVLFHCLSEGFMTEQTSKLSYLSQIDAYRLYGPMDEWNNKDLSLSVSSMALSISANHIYFLIKKSIYFSYSAFENIFYVYTIIYLIH